MKLASDVSRLRENRNAYKVLVENHDGYKIFRKEIVNGVKLKE